MNKITATLFFLIFITTGFSQKSDNFYDIGLKLDKIDKLFSVWKSTDKPGLAVGILINDSIVYKKGFGIANLEYNIPITPKSIFHVASVSKQFTMFSILLLEQRGLLSLKDDIRKYIPELPDFGNTITLDHLATHTSGLRDQWNLVTMAGYRMDDVITTEHILKMLVKQNKLNFDPGDEFMYCNTGYTLLAEVVSRVSEMSFAQFTQENIFIPLSMNNTLFYDNHEKIIKNRAYSYKSFKGGIKKSHLNFSTVGATGLLTTVEDLSLWTLNFKNKTVGNQSIFDKMHTLGKLNDGSEFGGARGLFINEYRSLKEIQHSGSDAGYRSYLTRFPEEHIAIIILGNSADIIPDRLAYEVVNILLEEKLNSSEKKNYVNSAKVSKKILESYLGLYEIEPGYNVQFSLINDQLYVKATKQASDKLIPISSTEFVVNDLDVSFKFIFNDGNPVEVVKLKQDGQEKTLYRVVEFNDSDIDLSEYKGRFYSEELSTYYEFKANKNLLRAHHSRISEFNLTPVKKDVFKGDLWFFKYVKFTRDPYGKINGIKVSTDRVRDLEFKKIES